MPILRSFPPPPLPFAFTGHSTAQVSKSRAAIPIIIFRLAFAGRPCAVVPQSASISSSSSSSSTSSTSSLSTSSNLLPRRGVVFLYVLIHRASICGRIDSLTTFVPRLVLFPPSRHCSTCSCTCPSILARPSARSSIDQLSVSGPTARGSDTNIAIA